MASKAAPAGEPSSTRPFQRFAGAATSRLLPLRQRWKPVRRCAAAIARHYRCPSQRPVSSPRARAECRRAGARCRNVDPRAAQPQENEHGQRQKDEGINITTPRFLLSSILPGHTQLGFSLIYVFRTTAPIGIPFLAARMGGKYGFMTRVRKSRRPAGFQLNTDPYLSLSLATLEQYYIAELSLLLQLIQAVPPTISPDIPDPIVMMSPCEVGGVYVSHARNHLLRSTSCPAQ